MALATLDDLKAAIPAAGKDPNAPRDGALQFFLDAASDWFLTYTGRVYDPATAPAGAHVRKAIVALAWFEYQQQTHAGQLTKTIQGETVSFTGDRIPDSVQVVADAERVWSV